MSNCAKARWWQRLRSDAALGRQPKDERERVSDLAWELEETEQRLASLGQKRLPRTTFWEHANALSETEGGPGR